MSLKSQIETTKDAVSKALITALEEKNETVVTELMNCYNILFAIKTEEPYNFNWIGNPYSINTDDVITFSGLS